MAEDTTIAAGEDAGIEATKTPKAKKSGAKAAKAAKAANRNRPARKKAAAASGSAANFLEPEVRAACRKAAKDQGMEMNHFLQKAVETYMLVHGDLEPELRARISAKRQVIDGAVRTAREIDGTGGFDENFVLNVMKAVTTDPETGKLYETAIGGKVTDEKAPRKSSLNQQLGRVIKTAVGAKAKRNEAGRLARAQVAGEAITSYTLLEKTA